MKAQRFIDVEEVNPPSSILEKRKKDVLQAVEGDEKLKKQLALNEARDLVTLLENELDEFPEAKWNKPSTWIQYSASELRRGDAIRIEDSGVLHTYIYLHKMAWWRSKTANILIGHKDNPDKQKRIGEFDFVHAFKGYMTEQSIARMGGLGLW